MPELEPRPQSKESLSQLERQLHRDPFMPQRGMDMTRPEAVVAPSEETPSMWGARESITLAEIKRQRAFSLAWKVIAGIVAIVAVTVGVVVWQRSAFHTSQVTIKVEAPAAADMMQDVQFTVSYANGNRVPLNNVEVDLYYPSGFVVSQLGPNMVVDGSFIRMKVGTVAAHDSKKVALTGKFFSNREDLSYLQAVIHYTPSTLSSVFETSSQISVALRPSALTVDIDTPLEIASGSMVEYLVTAINTGSTPLSKIRLQVTPPEGFVLTDSNPKSSEGEAVWYVGTIDPHQKLTFRMSGTLSGSNGEVKNIKADFGAVQDDGNFLSFVSTARSTKLVPSPLAISQTVNDVVKMTAHPGDRLAYTITYRNQGSIPLRNLILTFEIHSDLFDLSHVLIDGGSYDAVHRTITWKASDHPQLAIVNPGESGSIRFVVSLLRQLDPQSAGGVNPVVVTVAKVDSLDIPTPLGSNKVIASNRLTIPLASMPSLAAEVRSVPDTITPSDTTSKQYSIRLIVNNTSNALKDAKVKASLAPNVYWVQTPATGSEHVTFTDRTNEIVWDLGGVTAHTGGVSPGRFVEFQVRFTPIPGQSRVNQNSLLMDRSVVLTATDTFTQSPVQVFYSSSISTTSLLR
jgi:hypothetical protein